MHPGVLLEGSQAGAGEAAHLTLVGGLASALVPEKGMALKSDR